MKKYKEYKDETPERTINLIRSILTDLDLLLLDSNANCDNIFACRVILGNHDLAKLGIGMNGKGSTFEYALASGYAEFMEKNTKPISLRLYTYFLWNKGVCKYSPT